MRRRYLIQGQPYDVVVTRAAHGALCIRRAERQCQVRAEPMADGRLSLNVDGRTQPVWVAARGDSRFVHNPATGAVEVETVHVTAASGGGSGGAALRRGGRARGGGGGRAGRLLKAAPPIGAVGARR